MKNLTIALLCVLFATLCGCHHHHHHRHQKDVIHLYPSNPAPHKPGQPAPPAGHHHSGPYKPGTKPLPPPPHY